MLSLIAAYTQAQDSTKTNKTYRNHIGINTQFAQDQFFNPQSRTPIQFMYKRQNKKNNGAWRFGADVWYQYADSSANVSMTFRGHTESLILGVSVGYEWQKNITKKWICYYGTDLKATLDIWYKGNDFGTAKILSNYPPFRTVGFNENQNQTLRLKNFIGLRYQVLKRCYLNFETSIVLDYHKTIGTSRYDYYDDFNQRRAWAWGDRGHTDFTFGFVPYSGIYINYLF
jgi:hypothetical protein